MTSISTDRLPLPGGRKKRKERRGRRGQVWFPDVAVSAIFLAALIILYVQFSSNLEVENKVIIERLIFDSDTITETLLSSGWPPGWDADNVKRLGLTEDNHRLNETKLGYVANLSYFDRKYLLGTTYDYYIIFQKNDGTLLNITDIANLTNEGLSREGGMGFPNITLSTIRTLEDPDHMVRKERRLIYNSTAVKMILYLWV